MNKSFRNATLKATTLERGVKFCNFTTSGKTAPYKQNIYTKSMLLFSLLLFLSNVVYVTNNNTPICFFLIWSLKVEDE
jgi:hypothetical protein